MIGNILTSLPGMGGTYETLANEFRWGGDYNNGYVVGGQLSSAAADSGNTPTTTLRCGLVLGTIAASGLLAAYGASNSDGTQIATGILMADINTLDRGQVAQNQFIWMMVGGPVKPAFLYGFDEQARGQLANRFLFDDRNYGSIPANWSATVAKTASHVVLASESGTTFTTLGAVSTITFTLPSVIVKGFRARFVNEAAETMIIGAPASTLVAFNNLTATSVALQTGGNLIGSGFDIVVNSDATKYVAIPFGTGTVTVS